MKLLKSMVLAVVVAWASDLVAGGSVGGGTGMILDLDSPNVTSEQFRDLMLAGMHSEPVTINDKVVWVKSVDFQKKTVEVEYDEGSGRTTLHHAGAGE